MPCTVQYQSRCEYLEQYSDKVENKEDTYTDTIKVEIFQHLNFEKNNKTYFYGSERWRNVDKTQNEKIQNHEEYKCFVPQKKRLFYKREGLDEK